MLPILMLVAVMSSECLVVDGEKILASHLAAHIPSIGGIHEDTSFGFTPKAGVRRIIPGFEVAAFAARHGVTISSDEEICVIRPSRKLTDEEVQQSLIRVVREIAETDELKIHLLDYSRHHVPLGEIRFLKNGWHHSGSEGTVFWRGVIRTNSSSNFPVWAKARITVLRSVVYAGKDLEIGDSITPDLLFVRKSELNLMSVFPASSLQEVVGRSSVRKIAMGDMVSSRNLRSPREVLAGEVVEVSIQRRNMRLQLEAKAESSGRRGEKVLLRNPVSGQRFEAKVTGVRQAMVEEKR